MFLTKILSAISVNFEQAKKEVTTFLSSNVREVLSQVE